MNDDQIQWPNLGKKALRSDGFALAMGRRSRPRAMRGAHARWALASGGGYAVGALALLARTAAASQCGLDQDGTEFQNSRENAGPS